MNLLNLVKVRQILMNSIEFISDAYTEDGLAIIESQVKSSKQKVEEWI